MVHGNSQPLILYFDPKPNYSRIGKHFSWPGTPEQMQEANPEGFLIAIDWWQSREDIDRVENGLKQIVDRYDLTEYYDDILLLLLTKYKEVNSFIIELEDDFKHRK